jgi:uncharacterized protein (TIGR02266 family)
VAQEIFADQLVRAKESIGRALGLMQDVDAVAGAQGATAHLAAAVRALFEAERGGGGDPRPVARAMDRLRSALGPMQDACRDRPQLEPATAAIARTLAMLFPLLAQLRAAEAPAEEPVPLVMRAPRGEVEEPLPLTARRPAVAAEEPLPLVAPRAPKAAGRERRVAVRREVEVEIGIQSDTNFYTGFSSDISSGGIFVATYDVPTIGTAVNVNFSLPRGPVMSIDGTVRWIRDLSALDPEAIPGMGVEFGALAPEQAAAINAYIAVRQPIFYED